MINTMQTNIDIWGYITEFILPSKRGIFSQVCKLFWRAARASRTYTRIQNLFHLTFWEKDDVIWVIDAIHQWNDMPLLEALLTKEEFFFQTIIYVILEKKFVKGATYIMTTRRHLMEGEWIWIAELINFYSIKVWTCALKQNLINSHPYIISWIKDKNFRIAIWGLFAAHKKPSEGSRSNKKYVKLRHTWFSRFSSGSKEDILKAYPSHHPFNSTTLDTIQALCCTQRMDVLGELIKLHPSMISPLMKNYTTLIKEVTPFMLQMVEDCIDAGMPRDTRPLILSVLYIDHSKKSLDLLTKIQDWSWSEFIICKSFWEDALVRTRFMFSYNIAIGEHTPFMDIGMYVFYIKKWQLQIRAESDYFHWLHEFSIHVK